MKQSYAWMILLATLGLSLLGAGHVSVAAALNCKSAADCGGSPASCELTTYQTCAGKDPACPAGSSCGEKPTTSNQANCGPYVEGTCRFPHELPCRVDTDCGLGFRCAEQIGMSCAGMGSSGSSGVGPTWHEECRVSRGTFACELDKTTCRADRDCIAGLHCQQSDTDFCHKRTCAVDADCTSGLRCRQAEVSFCWTSFAPPAIQELAVALDACSASPPMLCAPRGYFSIREPTLADSGVASTELQDGEEHEATADSERPADARGEGCAVHGVARTARVELSWVALLFAVLVRRRHRAGSRRKSERMPSPKDALRMKDAG